ncbi:Na+/H+ antiporter subunit E [Vallitalea okinawensis]|uniref:Na+/H+ antiporter subunit E n=1 Tax=Vallitalea okinawensis TaxID=2078660 RepID=UPI000CFC3852|nr:Na+/H+ antiporter subunit E [Vallitalea okinawensis]
MKKLIHDLPFSVISTLLWCILNESFQPFIIVTGLLLGFFSLGMGRLFLGFPIDSIHISFNLVKLFKYIFVLIINIYKASLKCILLIIKGHSNIKVVSVKTHLKKDWHKVVLSNSVTLTPGTITIDFFKDTLLVLTLSGNSDSITDDFESILVKEDS